MMYSLPGTHYHIRLGASAASAGCAGSISHRTEEKLLARYFILFIQRMIKEDMIMNGSGDNMNGSGEKDRIEVTNPKEELERGNPIFEQKPDLGDEEHATEMTEANHEIEMQHGEDISDGDKETRLEQVSGHSVDEHMSAGSESPEDKVQDVINSGIIWM